MINLYQYTKISTSLFKFFLQFFGVTLTYNNFTTVQNLSQYYKAEELKLA